MLLERLASAWRAPWRLEKKFQSRLARLERDERRIVLCQPQCFMNSSGEAVAAVTDFYQLPLDRMLVAVDDADLALGQLRLRPSGSSGGHHGLESIEQHLATRDYPRLRLGIGRRAEDGRQITDYVLGRFLPDEKEIVDEFLTRAAEAAECWLKGGVQEAMNRFNGAATAQNKGKT